MKPIILCIMDGWGVSNEINHNAIKMGNTPVFDELLRKYPNSVMQASGAQVGLPPGQMGNSEVGHMNLGAGRVVVQDLPRINDIIKNGLLIDNLALSNLIKEAKNSNGRCHLIGLLSDGGVHSHQSHLEGLANFLSNAGIEVCFHAILDGRDTSPHSAKDFVRQFKKNTRSDVFIATLIGRFYAMDRDNRWERIEKAFNAIVHADGKDGNDPLVEIDTQYKNGTTDEFLEPVILNSYPGIQDGDTLLFGNFRADRARELLSAVFEPNFSSFNRSSRPIINYKAGLVSYSESLDVHMDTLITKTDLEDTIGEVVSTNGLRQLRIAETEKYPHVTFFLNGGREDEFEGEERILVPSPKVTTYDLQPEMSAELLTDKLLIALNNKKFDFIVVNYANPDMVGHTGDLKAAIKAVETVDRCIGRLVNELENVGGLMFLTSDHGNCEVMLDHQTGGPHTSHTTNLVPTLLVNACPNEYELKSGKLADVAPTLLELLGLTAPKSMSGKSLLAVLKN